MLTVNNMHQRIDQMKNKINYINLLLHHYKVLAAIYSDIKERSKFVLLNTKSNTTNLLFWGKNLWIIEENEIICFFVQLWRWLHKKNYQIGYTAVTIDDQKPRHMNGISRSSVSLQLREADLIKDQTWLTIKHDKIWKRREKRQFLKHTMCKWKPCCYCCPLFFFFLHQHIEIRILDL